MTLRAIANHRNFFSDYWLGTLSGARASIGPRLPMTELRKRMRRLCRLVDSVSGVDHIEFARLRERFARPLLTDVFEFSLSEREEASRIHLLYSVSTDANTAPLAAVYLAADTAEFDRPSTRNALDAVLASAGLSHGFILSTHALRVIRRAGDGPRLGALDISLGTLRELEDDASLQAAYRIVSAQAFMSTADGRRPIDVLEAESREHSAKVSSELKAAVFRAAETLVGAFQRDVAARPEAFGSVTPTLTDIRDAGFLALYRLLFILYAESRDERLAAHRLYRDSYGLDGLVGTLLKTQPELLPANRVRYWSRLRVLFRVFNDGLAPNLPGLDNIPPRGGRLFSDHTPEGALLTLLKVDDRALREVLLSIATTRPRRGVGRERVSFRELEIEQLGSVYEGLLEYEPAIADELCLEVRLGGRDLVLAPDDLVFLCEHKQLALSGDHALVVGTSAEHLHPANVPDEEDIDDAESDADDDGDDGESISVKSGTPIRLLRRLDPGTFYFRAGGARKASGSYYTPTAMVDFLVREALEPLTEARSASEIEQLRVVDIACGSAHFLVGAARFLAERLHAAHLRELGSEPPRAFAPLGSDPARMRARWKSEGLAWCKRRVVERCLYGVDLSPAAVQLAQVALWIESLAGDRPLSFFAHHIRVGNSLQGTFADRFDSPPDPRLSASSTDAATLGLFESNVRQRIEAALGERRLIDAELPAEIRADSPEEFRYKEDRLRRSEASLADARLLMDLRSAAPFLPAIWADLSWLSGLTTPVETAKTKRWYAEFERVRARERFFHWELEFPEVLLRADRPGFDAVLGNPPWDKVLPNKTEFYSELDPLLIAFKGNELDQRIRQLHKNDAGLSTRFDSERERTTTFARVLRKGGDFPLAKPTEESDDDDAAPRQQQRNDQNAHEDLAKYFVDRSLRLAREGGAIGLVIPAVVYNGDGCVGIRQHLLGHTAVSAFYAFENRRRIFPIHASYKFANLAARIGADGAGAFDAAFMRHDLTELANTGPKPWMIRVTRAEVEQLSPETLSFLEFRGPRDQDIVRKMSLGRPTFGGKGPGSWGTRLISWRQHEVVYNSTEDRDLMTDPTTGTFTDHVTVLGSRNAVDATKVISQMALKGYWPIFGGEQIAPFLVGVKPLKRWLRLSAAEEKYGARQRATSTVVFRDQARNTDERTCIAALLQEKSGAAYTLTAATFQEVDDAAAVTVLNSMSFDYLLRVRMSGMHVSGTYILPVAFPKSTVVNRLPTIPTKFAPELGVGQLTEIEELWPSLWAAERSVAEAYGLGAEDFVHVLETFPVWLRKRPGIAAYYRAKLADWEAQ